MKNFKQNCKNSLHNLNQIKENTSEIPICFLKILAALQIFIVILLCKSIKVMKVIYNLMIENFFCKFHY